MNIAELSIRYKTITLVLTLLIIGGGIMSYDNLGRLEDPEFTIKDAQIFTQYPGATAMQVAEEVTDEIETAVQQMGQLDTVTSISEPGLSTVKVEIKEKYDKYSLPQVWDELRRKVNDVQSHLPPGSSTSIVYDDFGDVYGILYAIYGDGYTYAELKEHAKMLRRELLLVKDVAKVSLSGMQSEVVYIEISRAKISQLGISPDTIYSSISGQNLIVESGEVKVGNLYLRINPTGEFTTVEEIGELLILQADGSASKLRLKDIATVTRGYVDPPETIIRYNGKPAIAIGISTTEGGNVVTMGEALKRRLSELEAETPIGIELGVISMQSDSVQTAISGFVVSLGQALAIVIAVLMVAMGLRSAILIGVILLLTILATFIVMDIQGIMLERISLGALIIALGMLVDNAIVVVEGILVNSQKGMTKREAASKIVKQTAWPLFGATTVAVLAFAGIGVSQDSTGEYCRSLFLVILISLMMSWVLAITVTPLFGVMFLRNPKTNESTDPYKGLLFQVYKIFLMWSLRHRVTTVVALVAMLFASVGGFRYVKQSFFPDSTRPQFMVHYWLPQGTHVDKTHSDVRRIEEHLLDIEGVMSVSSFIGQGAPRFILTYAPEECNEAYALLLVDVDDYRKIPDLAVEIGNYLIKNYPDSQAYVRQFALGPGDPAKIHARLRGPDAKVLRRLEAECRQIMTQEPTITDIRSDWRQRVPMIQPLVAETQARNAGITRSDISKALQVAFGGRQIGVFRAGDELLPMIARSPDSERMDVANLRDVQVWSPVADRAIPIQQVILGFETESEDSLIRRRNRMATITVKCDPVPGIVASDAFARLRPKVEAMKLPSGYNLEWGGEYEDSTKAQSGLASKLPVIGLLIVLTVIILFNSIRLPLAIFLTVPLAIIGVTAGLLTMKQPFGFMALLGILSLTGMLIKNAIVLIDEINLQIEERSNAFEAIIESGLSRVRPVSMAALTTVLGMLPLVTDAFFVSMAVTIMFGLAFATVLTLIVVPVLYAIFFRVPCPTK